MHMPFGAVLAAQVALPYWGERPNPRGLPEFQYFFRDKKIVCRRLQSFAAPAQNP